MRTGIMINNAIESKQYCEILEVEIVSLRLEIENSNTRNWEPFQVFEQQENELKEETIRLKMQLEEARNIGEGIRKKNMEKEDQCQ